MVDTVGEMMATLLVVDDEPDIIETVRMFFGAKGYRVLGAGSADEAASLLSETPDLILLDIMMRGMDGISFCRRIREQVLCPILFLTARTEEHSLVEGLAAGGDDYISKPFRMAELHARVEAHLRRESRPRNEHGRIYFPDIRGVDEEGPQALWIDYGRKESGYGTSLFEFTKKEYLIVELLSSNPGQIFSQEQIYEKVWGYQAEGDAGTSVMEYVKRIRKKLGSAASRDWIETVWGIGYRWRK